MPRRRRRAGRGRRSSSPNIRSFLEPCLLLLLHMEANHGYELAQELAEFGMKDLDTSIVYRMLRDMEDSDLIESEWETAETSGPARRVYHLTREGHRALQRWVERLRSTDRILHHFFDLHDRHMDKGSGDFH